MAGKAGIAYVEIRFNPGDLERMQAEAKANGKLVADEMSNAANEKGGVWKTLLSNWKTLVPAVTAAGVAVLAFTGNMAALAPLLPVVTGALTAVIVPFTTLAAVLVGFIPPVLLLTGLLGGLAAAFGVAAAASIKNAKDQQQQHALLVSLHAAQSTYNQDVQKYGAQNIKSQQALVALKKAQDAYNESSVFSAKTITDLKDKFETLVGTLTKDFAPALQFLANSALNALTYLNKIAKLPLKQAFESLSTKGVKGFQKFVDGIGNFVRKPIRLAFQVAFGKSDTLRRVLEDDWNDIVNFFAGKKGVLLPVGQWFGKQDFTAVGYRWATELSGALVDAMGSVFKHVWASRGGKFILGGAGGGAAIGTALGGPIGGAIGLAIGPGIGAVLSHYNWSGIGRRIANSFAGSLTFTTNEAAGLVSSLVAGVNANKNQIADASASIALSIVSDLLDPAFWLKNWKAALSIALAVIPVEDLFAVGGKLAIGILRPFERVFAGGLGIIGKLLDRVGGTAFRSLEELLPNAFHNAIFAVETLFRSGFRRIGDRILSTLRGDATRFPTYFNRAFSTVEGFVRKLGGDITSLLGRAFGNAAKAGEQAFGGVASAIVRAIGKVSAFVLKVGVIKSVVDSIAGAFGGVVGAIQNVIGWIDKAISAAQALASAIPDNPFSGGPGGSAGSTARTGTGPRHATGGIFTKPTTIGNDLFGEAGREAVIPLDSSYGHNALAKAVTQALGGTEFNFYLDGKAIDARVERKQRATARAVTAGSRWG